MRLHNAFSLLLSHLLPRANTTTPPSPSCPVKGETRVFINDEEKVKGGRVISRDVQHEKESLRQPRSIVFERQLVFGFSERKESDISFFHSDNSSVDRKIRINDSRGIRVVPNFSYFFLINSFVNSCCQRDCYKFRYFQPSIRFIDSFRRNTQMYMYVQDNMFDLQSRERENIYSLKCRR